MTYEMLHDFFGWGALLSYGLLLVWFIFFSLAPNFIVKVHGKWFDITKEDFHRIHYFTMALYKILIFVFFLVPYVVMYII